MSNHFVLVRPIGVFHSFNHFRFERVSFFEQLLDAFRTCTLDPGYFFLFFFGDIGGVYLFRVCWFTSTRLAKLFSYGLLKRWRISVC